MKPAPARLQYRQPPGGAYPAVGMPRAPSWKIECAFYLVVIYSLTADVFGISVPLLAGLLALALSGWCVLQHRSHLGTVYGPIALLIACAAAYLVIEKVIHATPGEALRPFMVWILQLMIIQSLCLRRGFTLRYPLVLFALALSVLPFLTHNPGTIERARVDIDLGVQGGLSHPNGLAEWFGFFVVYFALFGLQAKRVMYRAASWSAAAGCLFVVSLTVGRGPIIAAALAIAVGFRRIFKRGFIPLLLLIILTGGIYASGMFDEPLAKYTQRGMEDTGREILWPIALRRIFSSAENLLLGVGWSEVKIYALSTHKANAPHNTFLYLALASGLVPLVFFAGFWMRAAWRSMRYAQGEESDPFRLPYLIYTLVVVMLADWSFMSPWALLTVAVAAGSVTAYAIRRFPVAELRNGAILRGRPWGHAGSAALNYSYSRKRRAG